MELNSLVDHFRPVEAALPACLPAPPLHLSRCEKRSLIAYYSGGAWRGPRFVVASSGSWAVSDKCRWDRQSLWLCFGGILLSTQYWLQGLDKPSACWRISS